MSRSYKVQLELDQQDLIRDMMLSEELIARASGDERQALLRLRELIKGTLKVIEKELNARH